MADINTIQHSCLILIFAFNFFEPKLFNHILSSSRPIIFYTHLSLLLGTFKPILHALFILKPIFLFLRSGKVFAVTNSISGNMKSVSLFPKLVYNYLLWLQIVIAGKAIDELCERSVVVITLNSK
jgi:hypothetical protein